MTAKSVLGYLKSNNLGNRPLRDLPDGGRVLSQAHAFNLAIPRPYDLTNTGDESSQN